MNNHIRTVRLVNQRLSPAEAEIWIALQPDQPSEDFELRGRLTGPHCPYASTVEIAYPVRPLSVGVNRGAGFQGRLLIPEPSLWEPQTPFLYFGAVELWQDGQRCDQVQVSHGLRRLQLGAEGLLVNGRPLLLHGEIRQTLTEAEAKALHDRGVNLLLTDVSEETAEMWNLADRFGLLILGRLRKPGDVTMAVRLRGHASGLGWLLCGDLLRPPWLALAELPPGDWVGAELEAPVETLPAGIKFVVHSDKLTGRQAWPAIVVGESGPGNGLEEKLGWIESY